MRPIRTHSKRQSLKIHRKLTISPAIIYVKFCDRIETQLNKSSLNYESGMVKSRVTHKEPIMGLRYSPYLETNTRDFGLYLWWAFCISMPNIKSTKQTLELAQELNKRGIKTILEHWDGHKHVDIYLPGVPLNIEVNGLQHYTNPLQIISDFNRVYYSDQSKCHTLSITNQLIETHLQEIATAIEAVSKKFLSKEKS